MSSHLAIPPNVCGKVQGVLKVKVDEVYWSRQLFDQILVNFKWWGSSENFTFFPLDITRKEKETKKCVIEEDSTNCLLFDVCTSLALFETYLKNCRVLLFSVINASDDTPLGEVKISQMNFILTQRPFSTYFPIVNDKGLHLGDLHVSFHLTMDKDAGKSRKRVKLKSNPEIHQREPDDCARVVTQGLELREAMLEPCVTALTPAQEAPEARLVDYLMGKELSTIEEELAIKTLRCISPAESLVEVASDAVTPRIVPKIDALVVKSEVPRANQRRSVRTVPNSATTSEPKNLDDLIPLLPSVAHISKTETLIRSKDCLNSAVSAFRLTVQTVRFSVEGLRKINYHPAIKPQDHKIRAANPPGVLFSVEVVIPFHPKGKSRYVKPFEITSRNFIGEEVIFGGAVVHKTLKGSEDPWNKVSNAVGGCQIKVLWRHLNQRIPTVLGVGLLPNSINAPDFETNLVVQANTTSGLLAAKVHVKIELGVGNCFGNELLGKSKTGSALRKTEHATSEPLSIDCPDSAPQLEPVPEEIKLNGSEKRLGSQREGSVLTEKAAALDNQLLQAIDSLQEKLKRKENVEGQTETEKADLKASAQEKKPCPVACCCCCKCCHGDSSCAKQPSSTCVGSTQIPSSSSSERATRKSHRNRKHRRKRHQRHYTSEGDETMSQDLYDRRPAIARNQLETKKWKEKSPRRRKLAYETDSNPIDSNCRPMPTASSSRSIPPPPPRSTTSTVGRSVIHRYKIDVYSCDAQVFYKAGLLEFYLSYRFPQLNPVYRTVEFSKKPTTIELSGEPSFQSHILEIGGRLGEALRPLSGSGIAFEIWARSYLYDKRNFLIGQADLPINRLLEWEASYDYSEKRRVGGNFYPPDKHFVNLRMKSVPGELPPGVDGDMISQLGLEVEYEKVVVDRYGVEEVGMDFRGCPMDVRELPGKSEENWGRPPSVNVVLKKSQGTSSWTIRTVDDHLSSQRDCRGAYEAPLREGEKDEDNNVWGARELQNKRALSPPTLDSPTSFTPYPGVPSFVARDLSPRRERDFPEGTQFVDFSKETNSSTPRFPDGEIESSPVNYLPELDNSIASDSKATQTPRQELTDNLPKRDVPELFSVRVEIEMALNLSPDCSMSSVKPTTYVEFQGWTKDDETTFRTPSIKNECNPEYHSSWNVQLPVHYLYKSDAELEFRLVYESNQSNIFKTYVDLTALSAGLSPVSGWFSLGSPGHKSAGQLKVSVTPLEDIRKYKEIWINEYKRQSNELKKYGVSSKCETAQKMKFDDSQRSECLRHKIQELEILTNKMKCKMANIQKWDKSPPDHLIRQVNEYSRRLDAEHEPLNVSEESEDFSLDEPLGNAPLQFISSSTSSDNGENLSDATKTRPRLGDPSADSSPVAVSRRLSVDSNSACKPGPSLSQCLSELEVLPKDSLDAASEAIERIICDLKKQKVRD